MQTVYFVNAFTTTKPLSGNPAAVCLLDGWLDDATMQAIAAQHNVSETAFVVPTASITTLTDTAVRAEDYHIRWFTPTVEIDLCGHATLATAHVLFEHLQVKNDCLVFASASGRLEVNRHPKLTLNFPARPLPPCDNTLFSAAFGMSVQAFSNGHSAIVVCDSPQTVAQFQPSFATIANLPTQVNYLTAKGDSYKGVSCDFVCRVFAPKAGIPEDPVTGSAYTSLGPYWAEQLGKPRLTALQLSARGGAIEVHVQTERVLSPVTPARFLLGNGKLRPLMDTKHYISQLSQLVAVPSVSAADKKLDTSNKGVVELLANWFAPLGFECRIEPVANHPGKFNLIAVKGQGSGGLVLAGHTDTVPYNAERWQQDPFTLTERDQRLYGLGATDMKGFFPVIWATLQKLGNGNFKDTQLTAPIIILATADEESSMSGARALVEQKFPQASYAIIGEPTGMRPITMHKGILMEAIRVNGKAGHSSNPALGLNAMEVMNTVMTELMIYRSELQSRYSNPLFDVSVPTLNLGCIHGGDSPNRICSACELHFDLRLMPGMQLDDVRQNIKQRLTPIAEKSGADIIFSTLFAGVPAFAQDSNSEFIQTIQQLTQHNPEAVGFATEAPFLQALGMHTVVMGPGSIDQAHQANEFIALSELAPAVTILGQLIKKYCLY